jgi:glycosyltransferase involved in cell wall biosynthesis
MAFQTGEVVGSTEKELVVRSNPRISFVMPAHNEEAVIGRTLQAVHEAAGFVGQPYEIIVVNDASTDGTAEIARQHGARVVTMNHRQIAATRNSGARAARGGWLFFVDADTVINGEAVATAIRKMENGAVGGGAPTRFDGALPLYARLIVPFGMIATKLIGFTGGAFMFCTRNAFQATGGFNERLYWAEEGGFAMALKREGRFVVLWKTVLTSGRRFRTLSIFGLPVFIARAIWSPIKTFTRRSSVQKIWYDSNREHDEKPASSFSMRVSNGIL